MSKNETKPPIIKNLKKVWDLERSRTGKKLRLVLFGSHKDTVKTVTLQDDWKKNEVPQCLACGCLGGFVLCKDIKVNIMAAFSTPGRFFTSVAVMVQTVVTLLTCDKFWVILNIFP